MGSHSEIGRVLDWEKWNVGLTMMENCGCVSASEWMVGFQNSLEVE